MRHRRIRAIVGAPTLALAIVAPGAAVAGAGAQFVAFDTQPDSPAIARWFPDPGVRYPTPGLVEGRADFTSHDEALAFVRALAARHPDRVAVRVLGRSPGGREMPLVLLTAPRGATGRRPTVLVLGQQHGNEPAGGEAALALADELAGPRAALLEQANVLIVPRANPDGAAAFSRTSAEGIDINRDHLLLHSPEARLLAIVAREYRPHVVLDLHEFTVGDRWIRKFGAVQRYDALIQAATVGNLHPAIERIAEREFVRPIQAALARAGQDVFTYHTTSPDPADKVVSMGGVQPDTGRNANGLRQAVSLLIETRGVGIGRQHFTRRVHAHVLAALAAIERAGQLGARLLSETADADAETSALACRGEAVLEAGLRPSQQTMRFLDAKTGAERTLKIEWRAAAPLRIERSRARPCGYVLDARESTAAERLRALGVEVRTVGAGERLATERFVVTASHDGERQDARGAVEGGASIRVFEVRLEHAAEPVTAGSLHISLAQPLASLVIAALEPDTQNSYAANGLLDVRSVRRVVAGGR
jgi:hypothetical protein